MFDRHSRIVFWEGVCVCDLWSVFPSSDTGVNAINFAGNAGVSLLARREKPAGECCNVPRQQRRRLSVLTALDTLRGHTSQ